MHVVFGDVPLHDLHLMLPANVPNQIAHPRRYLSTQRRPPVFRYPDQMQMNLEYGMRAVSVFSHPRRGDQEMSCQRGVNAG
jgi:hypothetical protein